MTPNEPTELAKYAEAKVNAFEAEELMSTENNTTDTPDEIEERLHISSGAAVYDTMEDLFTKTANLLNGAATALDSQWCEKDKNALRELAKAFSEGIKCCSERSFNIEFVHGKDGEYVRCRKCGYSYGSAAGFLICQRLSREENHKLFYENARLRSELTRDSRLREAFKITEICRTCMSYAGDSDDHTLIGFTGHHPACRHFQARVIKIFESLFSPPMTSEGRE